MAKSEEDAYCPDNLSLFIINSYRCWGPKIMGKTGIHSSVQCRDSTLKQFVFCKVSKTNSKCDNCMSPSNNTIFLLKQYFIHKREAPWNIILKRKLDTIKTTFILKHCPNKVESYGCQFYHIFFSGLGNAYSKKWQNTYQFWPNRYWYGSGIAYWFNIMTYPNLSWSEPNFDIFQTPFVYTPETPFIPYKHHWTPSRNFQDTLQN